MNSEISENKGLVNSRKRDSFFSEFLSLPLLYELGGSYETYLFKQERKKI